jgi:hypothetical protein
MAAEGAVTRAAAVAALLAGLAGAVVASSRVEHRRRDLELVVSTEGTRGMPAHVAIATAALGTFRGLAVDYLWARADHLQDEGQYFEAQTLAEWITALQPRFPRVWSFQAWNLSYNISAATLVPEERWSWVARGIELLRARGIPLNPRSADLYGELALLFHGKIADRLDREHFYYKARFCEEMQEVLGDMSTGLTANESLERFRRVAEAPESLADLEERDPAVTAALAVAARHGQAVDEGLARMIGRIIMRSDRTDTAILGDLRTLPDGTNVPLMQAIRDDATTRDAFFSHIVPFLQRQVLSERYRMDVREMVALMERYGPLDWRHPDAHGLYWSERGVAVARDVLRRDQINELQIVRSRLHTLLTLVQTGRVDYDPVTRRIDLIADPRFIAAYERSLGHALELIASAEGVSAAGFQAAEEKDLLKGYARFLEVAVLATFLYGDQEDAVRHFSRLRDVRATLGTVDDGRASDTLESFVALRIAASLNIDIANTRQFIDAMVRRSLLDGLGKGDLDIFGRFMQLARTAYDRQFGGDQAGGVPYNKAVDIGSFPGLVGTSFASLLRQDSLPVIDRARIWAWAPEDLRRRAWPDIGTVLAEHARQAGFAPERAFPPPIVPEPDAIAETAGD